MLRHCSRMHRWPLRTRRAISALARFTESLSQAQGHAKPGLSRQLADRSSAARESSHDLVRPRLRTRISDRSQSCPRRVPARPSAVREPRSPPCPAVAVVRGLRGGTAQQGCAAVYTHALQACRRVRADGDAYVVVEGNVYVLLARLVLSGTTSAQTYVQDVSKFADEHPGGKKILLKFAGVADSSEQFWKARPPRACPRRLRD